MESRHYFRLFPAVEKGRGLFRFLSNGWKYAFVYLALTFLALSLHRLVLAEDHKVSEALEESG